MPNWVYNKVAVRGNKKAMTAFINEGLKNSLLPLIDENETISDAFNRLLDGGKHKCAEYVPVLTDEEAKKARKILYEYGLTMRTWLPMPDTFLAYDTTNVEEVLREIAKQQSEEYGVVGWYKKNMHDLGCKWDCSLTDVSLYKNDVDGDEYVIYFSVDTPWSSPEIWLGTLHQLFGVDVLYSSHEESNAFNFIACNCEVLSDYDDFEDENKPQEKDYEDEEGHVTDEYWDALYKWEESKLEEMNGFLGDYIDNYYEE
jgi:hypothetical protein